MARLTRLTYVFKEDKVKIPTLSMTRLTRLKKGTRGPQKMRSSWVKVVDNQTEQLKAEVKEQKGSREEDIKPKVKEEQSTKEEEASWTSLYRWERRQWVHKEWIIPF